LLVGLVANAKAASQVGGQMGGLSAGGADLFLSLSSNSGQGAKLSCEPNQSDKKGPEEEKIKPVL